MNREGRRIRERVGEKRTKERKNRKGKRKNAKELREGMGANYIERSSHRRHDKRTKAP